MQVKKFLFWLEALALAFGQDALNLLLNLIMFISCPHASKFFAVSHKNKYRFHASIMLSASFIYVAIA